MLDCFGKKGGATGGIRERRAWLKGERANKVVVLGLRNKGNGARVGAVVVCVVIDGISGLTVGVTVDHTPGKCWVEFFDVPG